MNPENSAPDGPEASPPRILVIRLSSLGDIVLTIPVYRNLKAHWPGCRVAALVKPQYAPVLEGHPCVDEVLPFRGLADALRRIRAGGYTHLLDLHGTLRSRLLCALAGIPRTLRYRKDALARRLFVALGRPSPALARHTLDRYLECLEQWGVPTPKRALELGDCRARPDPGLKDWLRSGRRRVLLAQTAFLGDATLTVPLAREIKRAAPGCRLSVLSRTDTAEIFRSSSWVDAVIVDDKRGAHAGIAGLWRLSRTLKAGGFELAVVPHRSLRSALAVWLAGIPRRIGFTASAGRALFTRTIPFSWGMHDLERNLGLLEPLVRAGAADDSVYLRPPPAPDGGVDRLLAQSGLAAGGAAPLVGVHPGSIWPTKRWPQQRYAGLIRRLALEAGARIVLVGGKEDAGLTQAVARQAGVQAADLAGKTSLAELLELMRRLSLFVTNDSGPMHVATASGVPTLAIFGPTTRELGFFPYGPGHRVLEAELACRPCGLHGARACPEGHFLCMRLISVDEAFRNAVEMLAARAAGSAV